MKKKPTREKDFFPPARSIKTVTTRASALLDALCYDGDSLAEAALKAGYQVRHAIAALNSPVVRKEYERRIDEVRTGERARNIHAVAKVRDIVFTREEFTAAEATASLKAASWLHGEGQGGSGSSLNVQINVSPGYVIDLSEPVQGGEKRRSGGVIDHNVQ